MIFSQDNSLNCLTFSYLIVIPRDSAFIYHEKTALKLSRLKIYPVPKDSKVMTFFWLCNSKKSFTKPCVISRWVLRSAHNIGISLTQKYRLLLPETSWVA